MKIMVLVSTSTVVACRPSPAVGSDGADGGVRQLLSHVSLIDGVRVVISYRPAMTLDL